MDWLRKAWAWLKAHRFWFVIPAVLAGVASIVALARRGRAVSPSGPPSGPSAVTGDDAEAAREDIRETAADQEAAIKAKAKADRERLGKVLGRIVR